MRDTSGVSHSEPAPWLSRVMDGLRESPRARVEQVLQVEGLQIHSLSPEVLVDLVSLEWTVRLEAGDPVVLEEYRQRFPLVFDPLQRQWELEQQLGQLSSEPGWNTETVPHLPASLRLEPGGQVGKYRIVGPVGSGGQADVWRAIHPDLQRDVILKVIRSDAIPDAEVVRHVATEGPLLARLVHPHIAQVYDCGHHDGAAYLVLEFVPGVTLDQFRQSHSPGWREWARLLAQVARAVAAAHELGILHRDIKPQNILIRSDGQAKLIDFGLAELRDAWHSSPSGSHLLGTLPYMAPEQAMDSSRSSPRSDVFSLGAVLYALLTGHPPYAGTQDLNELYRRVQRGEWDRTALRQKDLPPRLVALCEHALARDPAERCGSAAEFARELESFSYGPSPRTAWVAFAAAGMALLAVAAVWWPRPARNPTQTERAAVRPADLGLRVQIHDLDLIRELTDAVPLHNGQTLRIEASVPADQALTLWSISGDGTLRRIASLTPESRHRIWSYPSEGEAAPLTGPPGTECLLIVMGSSIEVLERDVPRAWHPQSWPAVPETTVLRLTGQNWIVEQAGRDLGSPVRSAHPVDVVRAALTSLSRTLEEQALMCEALVFHHASE